MKNLIRPSSALAALLVVGPATAQIEAPGVPVLTSQGMFAGLACGMQVTNDDGSYALQIRTSGINTGSLVDPEIAQDPSWFGADYPDYGSEALFRDWIIGGMGIDPLLWQEGAAPSLGYLIPELAGVSTGGDVCPEVSTSGLLSVGATGSRKWLATSFVVDSGSTLDPNGFLASVVGPNNSPAGHVFTYTADGSVGIASSFAGTIRVEYTRPQLPLGQAGVGSGAEVSALDWGMGFITDTPTAGPTRIQPQRRAIYYAFTQDWIDDLAGAFGAPYVTNGGVQTPVDTTTIYYSAWDGLGWSDPAIAWSAADLFGAGADVSGVAIDAISVDVGFGSFATPDRVVFSTGVAQSIVYMGGVVQLDQILVAQRQPALVTGGTPLMVTETTSGNAVLVSERAGLAAGTAGAGGEPNVGGICNRDPGDDTFEFDQYLAIPVNRASDEPASTGEVGLSLMRTLGSSTSEALLRAQITGVDTYPGGIPVAQLSIAEYDITNPDLPRLVGTWTQGMPFANLDFDPVTQTFASTMESDIPSIRPLASPPQIPDREFRIQVTVTQLDVAALPQVIQAVPGAPVERSVSVSLLR